MIVKVQRSLFTDGDLLIYDQPRQDDDNKIVHEIFAQIHVGPEGVSSILGDDLKGYFEAEIHGTKIVLGDRVPDQDW